MDSRSSLFRLLRMVLLNGFAILLAAAWGDAQSQAGEELRKTGEQVTGDIFGGLRSGSETQLTQVSSVTSIRAERLEFDKVFDYSNQINPQTLQRETAEMRGSAVGNALVLHPFPNAPGYVEKTVTVTADSPALVFSARGHLNGDFLARIVVLPASGQPEVILERTIAGRQGWQTGKLALDRYRGQLVTVRFEAHATGWSFEYAALANFYFIGISPPPAPTAAPGTMPQATQVQPPTHSSVSRPGTLAAGVRQHRGDFFDHTRLRDYATEVNALPQDLSVIANTAQGRFLTFHPGLTSPWFIEEALTLPATDTRWEFAIRGHPAGDFLAQGYVIDQSGARTKIYERTVVGSAGWYRESLPLSSFAGKSVTLRLEGHATGWQFEHAGIDYFYVVAHSGLLGAAPASVSSTDGAFDGSYYNAQFSFGFRISGNQGIATVSNSPNYKVGDVMLRFTRTGPKSFAGEQLCTDGVFHPVTADVAADGSLMITIQGCSSGRYVMERQAARR